MDRDGLSADSAGSLLFPEYATLYDLISSEVDHLTEEQLDFESQQWDWSKWSIRRQLCHMASVPVGWLTVSWADTLFPDGRIRPEDFKTRTAHNLPTPLIMEELRNSIRLVQDVLAERSVGFLRASIYILRWVPEWNDSMDWSLMLAAHPTGLTLTDDPTVATMTLEATIRHLYFEEITHLYNIQRLKRAQGILPVVDLPRVGYWAVEGWDVSEPA